MKFICLAGISGISLLVAAGTSAMTISALPFEGSIADDDLVAQVTVISARLHEYAYEGEIRTCGTSYELLVNETVRGELPMRLKAADTIFFSSDTGLDLNRLQRALGVGERRLVSLKQTDEHRSSKGYGDRPTTRKAGGKERVDELPGWKQGAANACLAELPGYSLGFALRIEARIPAPESHKEELYVLLPDGWWVDDKLVRAVAV
jgi:hypothetical protein